MDTYYQLQDLRKASANQILSMGDTKEPCEVIRWFCNNAESLETQIKRALGNYAEADRAGRWSLSVYGIGPVIAAGLLAHIEIQKAKTAGAIWKFAGITADTVWQGKEKTREQIAVLREEYKEPWDAFLMLCTANGRNPFRVLKQAEIVKEVPDRDVVLATVTALGGKADRDLLFEDNIIEKAGIARVGVYKKLFPDAELDWPSIGQVISKRPFNAALKVLCWKIGQSFLKFSNQDECFYGHILRKRWALEKERNEQFAFAEQAREKLKKFRIGKNTEAYKAYSIGKLPPAHILQRSCRYATKLFLAHWQHVAWEATTGQQPVKPYVLEHVAGHSDFIAPPGWPCE